MRQLQPPDYPCTNSCYAAAIDSVQVWCLSPNQVGHYGTEMYRESNILISHEWLYQRRRDGLVSYDAWIEGPGGVPYY